ncbi:AAA family ATPase [Cystobacter fuscus]|uniref:AAA family ATPase n=1 Tax=Cystobacter fuscus TaxID=43 RepID=UPI0012FD8939|nr:ATP-binding protein [Cystobacter fuscus]
MENYRCFEQAVIEPGSLALLVGPNGAGKSTVFDALWNIRQLVITGGSASELFPDATRMRWGRQSRQRFELGFRGPDGDYTYRLVIRHGKGAQSGQLEREEILYEQQPLYSFSREEVSLHAHDKSPAHRFPAGTKLSPLSNLPLQVRSKRLDWLTDRISRIWVFRQVPPFKFKACRVMALGFPFLSFSREVGSNEHPARTGGGALRGVEGLQLFPRVPGEMWMRAPCSCSLTRIRSRREEGSRRSTSAFATRTRSHERKERGLRSGFRSASSKPGFIS